MKKSPLPILIGVATLFLLSGCIKMDVTQTINADKTSHIEVIYDASEFVSYMTSMEDSFEENTTTDESATEDSTTTDLNTEFLTGFEKACDEFLAQTTWTNPTCTSQNYIFTMAGNLSLTDSAALTTSKSATGTVYRYDLKDLYTQLNAVGESQDQDFSDAALQEQKEFANMSGITLTYMLTMPGTFDKADVGTISEDGKTVTINLFDMAGLESAYVESTVTGIPWLYIGGGVLLLVIVVGGVMMMKGKKKPTA